MPLSRAWYKRWISWIKPPNPIIMGHYIYRITPRDPKFLEHMTERDQEIMGRHWQYILDLHNEARIIMAGRTEDREYGIVIFTADNPDEARSIPENDPAVKEGVMDYTVHAYNIALPNDQE